MIVITPVKDVITGPFLSSFFNSSGMQQAFEKIRSGSTVPHLTCGAVKELLVALPDLATQHRLVKHAQELEAKTQCLAAIYQRKLTALDELKKSLLHQALAGKL
jgi:type I restriction enzyme S subunit